MYKFIFFILLSASFFEFNSTVEVDSKRQWSQFRGYLSSGTLDGANLPVTWDVKKSEHILWDIAIPGLGLSSPVIWGDNLFITTAYST